MTTFGELISPATVAIPHNVNPAAWMYERIVRSINDFEERLDPDHEVGARLVSFAADSKIHIENVGYWGPDIIIFYGVDNDRKQVQLLQHISQLSVLLLAVPKLHKEARRIGFELVQKLERDSDATTGIP